MILFPISQENGLQLHLLSVDDMEIRSRTFVVSPGSKLIVPGEMRRPHFKLGSSINSEDLQGQLAASVQELMVNRRVLPLIQCFSHMAHSENGVGILTNYNETRYFRINFKEECIYMSPVVKVDQKWDGNEQPHPLQAMLFATSFSAQSDEFTRNMAEVEVQKYKDEIKDTVEQEKSGKGSKGEGKKGRKPHGGSGAGSSKGVTAIALGPNGPLPDVSLVSAHCKHLRILGEGASGTVWNAFTKGDLWH